MTKEDVVKQIALNTGIDRYVVLKVVKAFTQTVKMDNLEHFGSSSNLMHTFTRF